MTANLHSFRCVDTDDLFFKGSLLSDRNSYFIFEIEKCKVSERVPECADDTEVQTFFNFNILVGVTGSSYIDFDDYSSSPIHTQLDYTFTDQMST